MTPWTFLLMATTLLPSLYQRPGAATALQSALTRPILLNAYRLYDDTPTPYSFFFHAGYAIHGTCEVRNLGRPVSHDCIRLSRGHARSLFELIPAQGRQSTTIEIDR